MFTISLSEKHKYEKGQNSVQRAIIQLGFHETYLHKYIILITRGSLQYHTKVTGI